MRSTRRNVIALGGLVSAAALVAGACGSAGSTDDERVDAPVRHAEMAPMTREITAIARSGGDGGRRLCADPSRTYISRDPAQCATIRFFCAAGKFPFFDDCGCGCQKGELCGDVVCGQGEYCCNESCSICAPTGGVCTQEYCGPEPSPVCVTNEDCRTFSDYCDGCTCRALGRGEEDPVCDGTLVQCFVDPCRTQTAACADGACTLVTQ